MKANHHPSLTAVYIALIMACAAVPMACCWFGILLPNRNFERLVAGDEQID